MLDETTDSKKQLELLAVLFNLKRTEFGAPLEFALTRFLDEHTTVDSENWNALAGAVLAAIANGYTYDSRILWRIVYQYPDWPVSGFVEDIARREGEKCHNALVECFAKHPSGVVKMGIFEYFERAAPRLGLRVTEIDGKLLLDKAN